VAEGPALLHRVSRVGLVQMNRPQASNGLDMEMLEAMRGVLRHCMGEPGIGVVLLSGRGPNFCAGGDVHTFASKGEQLPYYIRQATSLLQEVISALIHLDAPVIAAVQGYTAGGGGMGLLCASDPVIAADNARFLAGATRVGMAPDAGLSVTLPRLIGARRASEMLLSNNTVDAPGGLALGLVNRVVAESELAAVSMEYAAKLAAGAPKALAATKRLLWSGVGLAVDAAMPEESRTVADLCRTADACEGLAAVIGKRAPNFTGR